jgi:hypothetical protein
VCGAKVGRRTHERMIIMTNTDYKELVNLLKDYPNKKEVLDYIKSKNRCLGCRWNDGLPHSACYNCD